MTDRFDIVIGYDADVWIPLPTGWPHEGHRAPRSWVRSVVRDVSARSTSTGLAARSWLTEALSALARWSPEDERRYLYLPDIGAPPAILRIQYGPAQGDRDDALRAMVLDSDLLAVEPPVLESTETTGLGTGLRGIRHSVVDDADGTLVSTVVYGLRGDPYDVRVSCQVGGPEAVPTMVPLLDAFVDGISVEPAP